MPNQRRLDLRVAASLRDLADGAVVCAPPILVLSQWVEHTVVRAAMLAGEAVPGRIDAMALQLMWQHALERPGDPRSTAEQFRVAGQARAADRLLRQWYPGGAPAGLDPAFQRARRRVADELERLGVVRPEDWTARLVERLEAGGALPVTLPRRLVLSGFHELTALEQRLIQALEATGVDVRREQPAGERATGLRQRVFPDAREELAAAAAWALEQHRQGVGRIAVVFNGIDREPHAARRIFDNLFDTAARRLLADPADAGYHLPYGEPLLEHAVVEDALLLLQVAIDGPAYRMPFPRLSRWLLSPHWAGADEERAARARLEAGLRSAGAYGVSIVDVRERAGSLGLAEKLTRLLEISRTATRSDWRAPDPLHACLVAWGWPGPLARGTAVRRAVERFTLALERLRALGTLSVAESLTALRRMAGEQGSPTRGGPLSPVQLLTPEDAVGHRFDAAWVGNLHEGNWPGTPVRNPFLPGQAYRDIPRADPAGELAWSEHLTDGLSRLAPEVVFSWGRQEGDVAYAISPLVANIDADIDADIEVDIENDIKVDSGIDTEGAATGTRASLHSLVFPQAAGIHGYAEHPWLRAVRDTTGQPLRPANDAAPGDAITGGSAAFVDQSALPLLAYLKHRLAARFDDPPEPFADAAWRGKVLHDALRRLYRPSLESDHLPGAGAVPEAVEAALRESRALHKLSPVAHEAERQRLVRVLLEWLEVESERPDFRIHALEGELETTVLAHPIRLKTDRIDRLPGGRLLVIDYKSSSRPITGWARDRLGEAQLPLYACLLDGAASEAPEPLVVGGIALATVRHGECGIEGVIDEALEPFGGVRPVGKGKGKGRRLVDRRFEGWNAAMAHWRQAIETLAGEIVAGEASNRVFDSYHPDIARYQLLLRHAEAEDWRVQREAAT